MTTLIKKIEVDYHSHILPFMDDGASDIDVSKKMLCMLGEQGIKRVAATSHFDPRKEKISEFISRRDDSLKRLSSSCDMSVMPEIVLGAEVYFTEGVSEMDLSPLCYGDTDLLLLELPRLPYGEWIYNELEVISYKQKLVPVIAHIDRYMEWYSDKDIDSLLSLDDAVYQVNNNAFLKKKTRNRVCDIIKSGYRVVLGSDTHDIENRCPNFDMLTRELSKLKNRKMLPFITDSLSSVVI